MTRRRPLERLRRGLAAAAIGAAALALAPAALRAQQTIINVPSIDQTPKGHVFALHESQVRAWGDGRYWLSTNFLTYGLTDRIELATTFYNLGSVAAPNSAIGVGWKAMQPVLATRAPLWELKLGAGQMLQTNLRGKGVGVWNYAHGSARVPGLGLRLTTGISAGPRQLFGRNTVHFTGAYELPITKEIALLGEWWSGTHELADFVPGINYHTKALVVILGYKLSNAPGTATDGLIVEVGRTF